MCSVVGYIGKNYSRAFVVEGLKRLEYRGYDSAGFACLHPSDSRLMYAKAEGRLRNLLTHFETQPIDGYVGIGHTRWSTHGVASQENAHPHFDCEKTISVVHNGIIENFHTLKQMLDDAGHIFHSHTDTEVIAHLFETFLTSHKTFKAAVKDLVNHLEGAYAFITILQEHPDMMVLVRKRSPLCIGIGDDEMFVASDAQAFAGKTNKVVFLPDESFALVKPDMIELYGFDGTVLPLQVQEIELDWDPSEKQGHAHYMLKEMYEQKESVHATVTFLQSLNHRVWDQIGITKAYAGDLDTLHLIGCGTSWHAARIGQFFFEYIALLPTRVHLASEFRYMPLFSQKNSLYMALSQSGETADTLEALRLITSMQMPTLAVTNMPSSTMVRESDGFLLTQAGPEVAVASTKSFSTQLAVLYWFAHCLAYHKGIIKAGELEQAQEDLLVTAQVLENTIEIYKREITTTLAKKYARSSRAIFLGRHISYPFALEAALKLKELAYIFSQCYPAGELKHGPLALVEPGMLIIIISHQDETVYTKLTANAQEAKARGGHVVAFAFAGQQELIDLADYAFIIPKVKPLLGPLAMTGVMQYFVYAIAKELGYPIDKPRNLAKSVTVE